jgi:hypothetical protein
VKYRYSRKSPEPEDFPVIGSAPVLERQRTRRPSSPVQKFTLSVNLHFDAPGAMIAKFTIELPVVLPDRPKVFAGPRLARCVRAVGRVEGLTAHRRSPVRSLVVRTGAGALGSSNLSIPVTRMRTIASGTVLMAKTEKVRDVRAGQA